MARIGSFDQDLSNLAWFDETGVVEGWFDDDLIGLISSGPTTYTITPSGSITFSSTVNQLHIKVQEPSGSIVFSGNNSFIRNRTFSISGFILFDGTAPITWEPAGGGGGSVFNWRTLTGTGT